MDIFHIYLNFPDNIDQYINSREDGDSFIQHINNLINRADCEKGSCLYYDNSSKNNFFEELEVLQDDELLGFFGIFSFEDIINELLFNAHAQNWETNPIFDNNGNSYLYRLHVVGSASQIDDFPNVLKEITENFSRLQNGQNVKFLLLNIYNAYVCPTPICIIKYFINPPSQLLSFSFDSVSFFNDLESWFIKNRTIRNYNLSDNRHIEGHQDYIHDKSPILGGQNGKNHAAELLKNALGDQREKEYLVNFDSANNCYIRFEYENVYNNYHGYHLVKPYSHEVDIIAENEIPHRVLELLKFRYSNNNP